MNPITFVKKRLAESRESKRAAREADLRKKAEKAEALAAMEESWKLRSIERMESGHCPIAGGLCTRKCVHFSYPYHSHQPTTVGIVSQRVQARCRLWK